MAKSRSRHLIEGLLIYIAIAIAAILITCLIMYASYNSGINND